MIVLALYIFPAVSTLLYTFGVLAVEWVMTPESERNDVIPPEIGWIAAMCLFPGMNWIILLLCIADFVYGRKWRDITTPV